MTGLQVHALGWTHFDAGLMEELTGWSTDTNGGQALVEAAGRSCYQSWSKPNPATATNAGYLRHILEVGHGSVLEHGTVTFYITGVSRSLTHELVRHRHFSYSQLSQRFVDESHRADLVIPPAYQNDPMARAILDDAYSNAHSSYEALVLIGEQRGLTRKQARQAARAVLPNCQETRIVVTGNYRAWRHFVTMRATEHADVEIRALAVACLRELQRIAPNVFADFEVTALPDGTEVAASSLGTADV